MKTEEANQIATEIVFEAAELNDEDLIALISDSLLEAYNQGYSDGEYWGGKGDRI